MSQATPQEPLPPQAEPAGDASTSTRGSHPLPWIIAAVASLVALVAVGFLVLGSGGSDVTERGSSTPEEAATLFAESFVDQDLETAMSTFATESFVSNYSFVDHMERIQAFAPALGYLPTGNYEALNLEQRRGQVANALSTLTRSALIPEVDALTPYMFRDEDSDGMSAAQFGEALDPSGLSEFSVVRVDVIEPGPGSRWAEQTESLKTAYGAQDIRTAAILFDGPHGPDALGIEVIQYDGSWYLNNLFGSILPTNSNSMTELNSEAEYTQLVEQAKDLAQRD